MGETHDPSPEGVSGPERLMQALAEARAAYSTGGVAGASGLIKRLFDVCDEVGVSGPEQGAAGGDEDLAHAAADLLARLDARQFPWQPGDIDIVRRALRAALRSAPPNLEGT